MRVNISLDTIDRKKYKQITHGGDIQEVFKGIEAANKAELSNQNKLRYQKNN